MRAHAGTKAERTVARPAAGPCAVVVLLIAGACGSSPESEPVGGDLTITVMGDAPYYWHEARRYEHLVDALNADSLDWVIHVGDLFWKPCSDEKMRAAADPAPRGLHTRRQ